MIANDVCDLSIRIRYREVVHTTRVPIEAIVVEVAWQNDRVTSVSHQKCREYFDNQTHHVSDCVRKRIFTFILAESEIETEAVYTAQSRLMPDNLSSDHWTSKK